MGVRHFAQRLAATAGFTVTRRRGGELPGDFDPFTRATAESVAPYTMTSPERLSALVDGVRYLTRHEIPGALVECGVWRGGSMMAAALTLQHLGAATRELYLFDTYEGMPPPTEVDRDASGASAASLLHRTPRDQRSVWAIAGLEDVQANMATTGYPSGYIHYVPGQVESTIPAQAPEQIALLRLDTDWYESTQHELRHLVPRMAPGAVLIIDDYGHWQGARKAVDEYLQETDLRVLLSRIDYTGRIATMP